MNKILASAAGLAFVAAGAAGAATTGTIAPVNLITVENFENGTNDSATVNGTSIGTFANGPVGTTVDSGFNTSTANFGDFSGGAALNGDVFTYVQTVTLGPGDGMNDSTAGTPLPEGFFDNPDEDGDPGVVDFYALASVAAGFNGVAGYSFSDAAAADVTFDISETAAGGLQWDVATGEWTTGETINFFFQSSQAPVGPTGFYQIGNGDFTATARGPLPTPVPAPVPLPASILLLGGALAGLRFIKKAK